MLTDEQLNALCESNYPPLAVVKEVAEELRKEKARAEEAERERDRLLAENADLKRQPPDLQERFDRLAAEWKKEQPRHSSRIIDYIACWSYLKIIALGPPVVPLILRELAREVDHWFAALRAITDADPVPPEYRGNLRKMADYWIEWGKEKWLIE